jgi:uncharacterized membrane protein (DUF106 family)
MAPISVDENIQRIEKGIQEFCEKIQELREETNDKQEELDKKFQEYQMEHDRKFHEYQMEYENIKRSCDDAMNEGIQEYQSEMFRLEGCLITFKGFKKAGITEIVPPNETCQKPEPEPEPECKQPTHKEWVKHFHHMK